MSHLYRITLDCEVNGSMGIRYVGSRREARRIATAWRRSQPVPATVDPTNAAEVPITTIESIDYVRTKSGILHLLNRVGSHPDNG